MAGRYRRVGREHGRAAHFLDRRLVVPALLAEIANALKRHEGGMAFVQVVDERLEAQRLEHAHPADAEDDFLLHARFAIAAVQTSGELPIPRSVFVEVGVEEVQLDAAEAHAPYGHEYRAGAERHRGHARRALRRQRRRDRRIGPVQLFVRLLLPPVRRDILMNVALGIHEADGDERHAQVAGLLAVIAREHAETPGVNRQRLVQRELRREVRDRPPVQLGALALAPRVVRRPRRVETRDRVVVVRQPFPVGHGALERLGRHELEHPHRVVRRLPPERIVEVAEDAARVGVPAPPEVLCEILEAMDAIGQLLRQARPSVGSRQ